MPFFKGEAGYLAYDIDACFDAYIVQDVFSHCFLYLGNVDG